MAREVSFRQSFLAYLEACGAEPTSSDPRTDAPLRCGVATLSPQTDDKRQSRERGRQSRPWPAPLRLIQLDCPDSESQQRDLLALGEREELAKQRDSRSMGQRSARRGREEVPSSPEMEGHSEANPHSHCSRNGRGGDCRARRLRSLRGAAAQRRSTASGAIPFYFSGSLRLASPPQLEET